MNVRINTDGGARGNPGPAGAGVVIYDHNGREIFAAGYYLGRATNNVAEYEALRRGLEKAHKIGATNAEVRCDSELIVKQVNGRYRVKNARLKPLYEQVRQCIARFDHVELRHIYRSENSRADELVNLAIDAGENVHATDTTHSPANDATNHPTNHPTNNPTDHLTNNPTDRPTDNSTNDSTSGLTDGTANDIAHGMNTDFSATVPSVPSASCRPLQQHLDLLSPPSVPVQPVIREVLARQNQWMAGRIILQPGRRTALQCRWTWATLTVLQGRGEINIDSTTKRLTAGTWLLLAPARSVVIRSEDGTPLIALLTRQS